MPTEESERTTSTEDTSTEKWRKLALERGGGGEGGGGGSDSTNNRMKLCGKAPAASAPAGAPL